MSNHTPGPYSVSSYTPGHDEEDDPFEPQYQIQTATEQIASGIQVEADARLLAAAPDLLASLDALVQMIYEDKTPTPYSDQYRDALNAIAQATGEKA